ncbi:unnamed protein product [Anisakis simplex]|uniref:Retrovirus-related Pol polyprotein from transposon TNT 1-94 n=1 Tax=Anisakis simplex TaxID=6269 RepID=A0A0M3JQV8_ANISI|nr:unnamed protein product [Anisakis simplex]
MLNGLYGYIFGNDSTSDCIEEVIPHSDVNVLESVSSAPVASITPKRTNKVDDDWILVEDRASGRSSPVFVANLELEDLDSVSTISTLSTNDQATAISSPQQSRHSEAVRHAKMLVAQRSKLEQKLFEDPCLIKSNIKYDDMWTKSVTNNFTASKLKRSTAAGHVASESKIKPRKKKSGKLCAGRNNDRKVNNLN